MKMNLSSVAQDRHACDDFCSGSCGFCSVSFCLDQESEFVKKRIGDTMKYVLICPACDDCESAA